MLRRKWTNMGGERLDLSCGPGSEETMSHPPKPQAPQQVQILSQEEGEMNDKFILENEQILPCEDLYEWGRWMQTANRHVGHDTLDGIRVSTVFLGLDHSFHDGGPPVLFKTMVFGGEFDQEQERYCTLEEAKEGHARWLAKVLGAHKGEPA
jgi:hypothetical protein